MKSTLCLCLYFLLVFQLSAQCDQRFFRNTNYWMEDIAVAAPGVLLAVGELGTIIKSTDAGKNWRYIQTNSIAGLKSIQMVTDSIGYAVGGTQAILKTEDQGETWMVSALEVPANYYVYNSINDQFFFDTTNGFVVGDNGLVGVTKDGGRSWSSETIEPFASQSLKSICFINDSIGFMCGSRGVLYKTENRGKTWSKQTVGSGNTDYAKIKFLNDNTGFLLGLGVCLKTTDGGITWQNMQVASQVYYRDIHFFDANHGFVLGNGLAQETFNGGSTWEPMIYRGFYHANYNSLAYDAGKQTVFMVGAGYYGGRVIVSSSDNLNSFTAHSYTEKYKFQDVFALNDAAVYIGGGQSRPLKSTDYGETWQPLQYVPIDNNFVELNRIFFVDSLHGFATTDNVYKTSDAGASWQKLTIPGGYSAFSASYLYFFDTLTGIVGDPINIFKTTDGGNSWTRVVEGGDYYFNYTLAAIPSGKIMGVSLGGFLRTSVDSGSTWTESQIDSTSFIVSAYLYNDSIGYLGTIDGAILKTTDGGASWTNPATVAAGWQIRTFWFMDASSGYLIAVSNYFGGQSRIYQTKNGGASWELMSQISPGITRIAGKKTPIVVGEGGLIMRLDTMKSPAMPGYILGADKICINNKKIFKTGELSVNYHWSLTGGGTHTAYLNTDTVLVTQPGNYTLSLYTSNACGVSPVRTVNLEAAEFKPVISMRDSILTATTGETYQWFRNGMAMSPEQGGKQQKIVARLAGNYTASVKSMYGCTITTPPFSYTKGKWICSGATDSIVSNITSGYGYNWQMDDGSGKGYYYMFNNNYFSGTNTAVLKFTNLPSSYNGYKFRCFTGVAYSEVTQLRFSNAWTGMIDNAWENPANWSCNQLPDENSDVTIHSGTVVISSNVAVRQLSLDPSVHLTVSPGFQITITR